MYNKYVNSFIDIEERVINLRSKYYFRRARLIKLHEFNLTREKKGRAALEGLRF